jgi:hypothetical protein
LSGVVAVAASGFQTCALMDVGTVKCWGRAADQCWLGESCDTSVYDIAGISNAESIAMGGDHACVITASGDLLCWGANSSGQLGNGTTDFTPAPGPVAGLTTDADGDGCTAKREGSPNPEYGGARSDDNVWDFFDTPNASNVRDGAVTAPDFFRILQRFGATGAPVDPLSAPPPAPAYHAAFDRGPSSGPNPWNLTAADGSIAVTDFFAAVAQFGHSCA